MAVRAYARRYAQAVFEIAREQDGLDKWQAELERLVGLVADVAVLAWLEDPKVPFEAKARLLEDSLGDVDPLALNLVYLLLTRGRLGMAADIAAEYRRLLNSYRGIEPAAVVTAVPLDDQERQRLAEQLGAITGNKVVVEAEVAPALVGGFVARVGGKLLDGSTRSRLKALQKELAQGTG